VALLEPLPVLWLFVVLVVLALASLDRSISVICGLQEIFAFARI